MFWVFFPFFLFHQLNKLYYNGFILDPCFISQCCCRVLHYIFPPVHLSSQKKEKKLKKKGGGGCAWMYMSIRERPKEQLLREMLTEHPPSFLLHTQFNTYLKIWPLKCDLCFFHPAVGLHLHQISKCRKAKCGSFSVVLQSGNLLSANWLFGVTSHWLESQSGRFLWTLPLNHWIWFVLV